MQAIYGYDPAKWRLGTLCIHGHAWPGTQQSLRRIGGYKCAGCGTTSQSWLAGFIIGVEDGELPHGTKLSKPCKRHGHTYLDTGWCLRKGGQCVECTKGRRKREALNPDVIERRNFRARAWARRNAQQINARRCERLRDCLELRQRRNETHRRSRARLIARGLSSRSGASRKVIWLTELDRAIRDAGRFPTVIKLVDTEQRQYWRQHPERHRLEFNRIRKYEWRLKYLTNSDFRHASRERARRRHAQMYGNHVVHVTSPQVKQRFAEFNQSCAYCGCTGDLHQDHFLPISKGGTHVLSNIIPACQTCNFSKRDHDPETWYRPKSFFSEKRWRIILTVTGKRKGAIGQLALI
jgi:5-methylcytosine-specific restriction endonuclease McrA